MTRPTLLAFACGAYVGFFTAHDGWKTGVALLIAGGIGYTIATLIDHHLGEQS